MIETRLTNERISRDVEGIKSGLATSDRKHQELFEKLDVKFKAWQNDINKATDVILQAFRPMT